MQSYSRGAIFVTLDDQENIICTLPSHIATREQYAKSDSHIAPHGSCMRRQVRIAIYEGRSMRLYKAQLILSSRVQSYHSDDATCGTSVIFTVSILSYCMLFVSFVPFFLHW